MSFAPRVTKIGVGALFGGLGAALAALVFMLLPASLTKGEPPRPRVAVFVDTCASEVPQGSGLAGALQVPLSAELRPAPRAAKAFLDAAGLDAANLRIYSFDAAARRTSADRLLTEPAIPRTDGALGAALALAQTDLGKRFGPKLAIVWLDRPSVGPADVVQAQKLKESGWEVRVYGTVNCDPEAMRSISSDIHYAYREPKAGLGKATKAAGLDLPKRLNALTEAFTERPPLSTVGRMLIVGLIGVFTLLALGLMQGVYTGKVSGVTFAKSFAVAVPFAFVSALCAEFVGSDALWAAVLGLGAATVLGTLSVNARWIVILIGSGECGMLLGWCRLPLDLWWGATLMGVGLGFAAVFSEEVSRRRFLEVRQGKARRLLNLGSREISFGSSPDSSFVLADGNGRVAAVRVGPEGPYRIDTLTGRSRNLHPGEPLRVGRVLIEAHGRWGGGRRAVSNSDGPLVLRIGSNTHELAKGKQFSALQVPVAKGSAAGTVAEVTDNPSQPGVLGLTNRSGAYWYATLPTGAQTPVPPGRTVRLAPGTRISFGAGDGSIEPVAQ